MYAYWTFFQFQNTSSRREDLTATDIGNFTGSREYYLANNLKKRCIKRDNKGVHDRFLRDHIFRGRMIENSRDEEVCRAWDVLGDEEHPYQMSEEEYFYYKNSWWISLNKSGNDTQPLRTRSDLKQALSTLKRLHQESWRRPTRAHSLLEVQTIETSIEFLLFLVAMARFLVVCLRIQRKSRQMRQAKACDWSGQPVVYRTLAKTLWKWLSRIQLLCYRWIV